MIRSSNVRKERKNKKMNEDVVVVEEKPEEVKTPVEAPVSSAMQVVNGSSQLNNIMESAESFAATMRMAKALAMADILPKTFANKPGNCVILIDMVKRSGMSLLFVAQNLYIVSGNPAWSGQACVALINNSGRFTPLKYEEKYVSETEWSCTAYATEKLTGEVIRGTTIDYKMAKEQGWIDKSGSYWKKMPMQMAKYRSAAFFARTYCPEALFGLYTDDEQRDIHGYEEKTGNTVTFTTGGKN